jgi:hypothetical protein
VFVADGIEKNGEEEVDGVEEARASPDDSDILLDSRNNVSIPEP